MALNQRGTAKQKEARRARVAQMNASLPSGKAASRLRAPESGVSRLQRVTAIDLLRDHLTGMGKAVRCPSCNELHLLDWAVTFRKTAVRLLDQVERDERLYQEAVSPAIVTAIDSSDTSTEGGAKGGAAANLTGDEKAIHLAKTIRKKHPRLSDRELAAEIKKQGDSTVSNSEETLRRKLSGWSKNGEIPINNATAGRKPKRGRKS